MKQVVFKIVFPFLSNDVLIEGKPKACVSPQF
jgi:hypothetical protein